MLLFAPIQRFDYAVSTWCLCHRFNHYTARASRLISRTGDGHLYLLVALLVMVADRPASFGFVKTGLTAFAIELPIYFLLKNLFKRNRPQRLPSFVQPSDRYSLPSGHTAAAFLMALLIVSFYPALGWLVWPWAALVGLSRVLLGVHFITDIVAGIALGLGAAFFALEVQ
uniref:phosphatase PAP2 family protein n=1 Tax=Thaumasiovibrio occultus TaxID=1891184 RepID=UPI000B35997B|nr:phosphatase PAP2 family protein [Thaumasiovibrio occultus]